MPAIREDSVRLLPFDGELDIHTVRTLNADLAEAVGDPSRRVLVDLTDVTFIDSTGLGGLLNASRQLRRQRRPLALVVAEGPVRDLLARTGLEERFSVFADRESAVAWLADF